MDGVPISDDRYWYRYWYGTGTWFWVRDTEPEQTSCDDSHYVRHYVLESISFFHICFGLSSFFKLGGGCNKKNTYSPYTYEINKRNCWKTKNTRFEQSVENVTRAQKGIYKECISMWNHTYRCILYIWKYLYMTWLIYCTVHTGTGRGLARNQPWHLSVPRILAKSQSLQPPVPWRLARTQSFQPPIP